MLQDEVKKAFSTIDDAVLNTKQDVSLAETSEVVSIAAGIAEISGLMNARLEELLLFKDNTAGIVMTLNRDSIGAVFLDDPANIKSGDKVARTGRVVDVPVGEKLLGRVINPIGRPLDNAGPVEATERRTIEREAYPIMSRAAVDTPLQTGITAIDSFTPIGRGQRELIVGDRQTGKTAIALDTIINQKDSGVISIYCAIGQRASATAKIIADLKKHGVMQNCIVVVASGDDQPGMQYLAPYAATSIGEYFMEKGRDVLIVYDDLTCHARAYRQMMLLLRRPPGREAFPGDIFYIHSRLLERSTHLRKEYGGGSITSLPIVETEAGNISAYIPTNIISITDGQIYLSTSQFQKGILPAIDTGRSVSRVGGDAQLPAYSSLVGRLKLFYSQFEELESFAKFGTQLDKDTENRLKRGRAIRSVMKQMQYRTIPVVEQIAVLMATNKGLLDNFNDEQRTLAVEKIRASIRTDYPDIVAKIHNREKLKDDDKTVLLDGFRKMLKAEGLNPGTED